MRVLVAGAGGFVGRVLSARLAESGHQVIALKADLTDRVAVSRIVARLDVEAVCHLAGRVKVRESFLDPLGYFAVNVGGTINLLESLRGRPVRMVFLSTASVYGSRGDGALGEDVVPRPENPYAASKLAAESLIASVSATGAIGAVILRCFNIAGGYAGHANQNPTGIIPAVLRAAAGDIAQVALNGDGSAVREFTHVVDVADAVVKALDAAALSHTEILNIGTGVGITMGEVITTAERVTGRRIDVVHRPAAAEAHTVLADTTRARERLRWHPAHSDIEEIIRSDWAARSVRPSGQPAGRCEYPAA